MPLAWTYSSWVTQPEGTALRLSQLRLHIQEVSNFLATGSYSGEGGRSTSVGDDRAYLDTLLTREKFEAEQVGLALGTRLGWSAARPIL